MKDSKDQSTEVARLRAEIVKLSGMRPNSNNPRYLARRLADLVERKKAGENVRRGPGEHAVVRSFSLHPNASKAFDELLRKEKVSASELVREAIALLAKARGHAAAAAAMGAG